MNRYDKPWRDRPNAPGPNANQLQQGIHDGGWPAQNVFAASVPIYHGYALLTNAPTNGDQVYFDGTLVTLAEGGSVPSVSLNSCGRYRVATLQIMNDDTLVTQSAYRFNISALGKNLNKGLFMAAAGSVYYPGWLIPYGWDRILTIKNAGISAALDEKVIIQIGIVDASSTPGANDAP